MVVALDASTPAPVYGTTVATTSLVTASFTPPAGSIILAKIAAGDGSIVAATPTGSGLTFTSRVNTATANANARAAIFTATGGGTATSVTAAFSGSGHARSLVVEVWTGAQLAATPATHAVQQAAGSVPLDTLTTVAAASVLSWVCADWAAVSGASRAYRSSAVEDGYTTTASEYTAYHAWQQAATAGAQTYGLTTPSGQKPTLASIEVQSSGGAVAVALPRVSRTLQAVHRSNSY